MLSTLEASEVLAPCGEEAPTLNGQAESTTDSLERDQDLEPADEVTENGPTGEFMDLLCRICVFIVYFYISLCDVNLEKSWICFFLLHV